MQVTTFLKTKLQLQTVSRSCTYKFCTLYIMSYAKKISHKILYYEVMHQSYGYMLWYYENRKMRDFKLSEKERKVTGCWGFEHCRRPFKRTLISPLRRKLKTYYFLLIMCVKWFSILILRVYARSLKKTTFNYIIISMRISFKRKSELDGALPNIPSSC